MKNVSGRSVRLFLVEGKPNGLTTGEVMNWTGHVLTGPRSGLAKFLARPEVARTGVYLLHGRDPDDPDVTRLYIGESDHVGNRLKKHNQDDKNSFWERTCVITSKDQNITKAHVRYIESRLIKFAQAAGLAKLSNQTAPPPIALPEADQSDMEFFIDQIRLVLPVVGFDFLRDSPQPSTINPQDTDKPADNASPIFELMAKKTSLHARAQEIGGDFVVLKGSQAAPEWKQDSTSGKGYAKLHANLVAAGKISIPTGQSLAIFGDDVTFSSPSAAAAVILGLSANGRKEWKVEGTQVAYATWQDKQIADQERLVADPAQLSSFSELWTPNGME